MVLCVSTGSHNICEDNLKTLQESDFSSLHFHVEMEVEKGKHM